MEDLFRGECNILNMQNDPAYCVHTVGAAKNYFTPVYCDMAEPKGVTAACLALGGRGTESDLFLDFHGYLALPGTMSISP